MTDATSAQDPADETAEGSEEPCPHCLKPRAVCVCDAITPIANRIEVVVLQHPQEQDRVLGTGRLTVLHLDKAQFSVGLSWPSLHDAVGRKVDPQQWAILYLGPQRIAVPPGKAVIVDSGGQPVDGQQAAIAKLRGLILLDGSWSQAKALWWRNPWVLKARQLVINPTTPSLYGKLRKEPRRDSLSTLEATAFALSRLEGKPEIEKTMVSTFRRMLQRYRDALPPKEAKPAGVRPRARRTGAKGRPSAP